MFGRRAGRVNAIPDSGFVDGSTDKNSAAYSPAMTEGAAALSRVRQDVTQQDRFPDQSTISTGHWAEAFRGPSTYIDQRVGGQPGNARVLGWTTGLRPRKESRAPLTGRVLVMPSMSVGPAIGAVGRDNRANKLFAGVASQTDTYIPSTDTIAAQFVGRGITLVDHPEDS